MVSDVKLDVKQRVWDNLIIKANFEALLSRQVDSFHRSRLLVVLSEHSGDWLHALPITACHLRLGDEAIRIAVGLRLGCSLCQMHKCPCGALVESRGTHGLSCRRNAGRQTRHHHLNDLIRRAFVRADIPASKEPNGLS
jgi:hypothetical protein